MGTRSLAKRQQWQERLATWQASGMTQAGFCRHHHLSRHEMVYWKKLLHPSATARTPRFVAVAGAVKSRHDLPNGDSSALRLMVGDRYRLEIPTGTRRESLEVILDVLEARA